MKIYALILSTCAIIVFFLRFFYSETAGNVSHNLNELFNSHINDSDAKNIVYFNSMLSMLINYLIFYKHVVFKVIYILLIAINIMLLLFSLKQF